MKDYVIIHNMNKTKEIYPSLWITLDLKYVRVPPEEAYVNLKQSIIDRILPDDDWKEVPILKIIKENGNFQNI